MVKGHFGFDKESLDLFKFRLFQEPHIAPEYAEILKNSPDRRIRYKIEKDDIGTLQYLDEWNVNVVVCNMGNFQSRVSGKKNPVWNLITSVMSAQNKKRS